MSDHTPGPCGCDIVSGQRPMPNLGDLPAFEGWFEIAYCSLHTAAPELLAALEQLVEEKWQDEMQIESEWGLPRDPGYGKPSPELVAARAAIAKAKGQA